MTKVVDTNSLALHLKAVLDKSVQDNTGFVKYLSYQIHKKGSTFSLSSHIVTHRNGALYLHAMSYKGGLFKVTTFIDGKGAVTNQTFEPADEYLTNVYSSGNSKGLDLFYAYSSEEGYSFAIYTPHNLGGLSVPSKFNLKCNLYYKAIVQSISYMFRASVSRLRMLRYKKYTFGNVLTSEELKKEFSDAVVDMLVVGKQKGVYREISLGFISKGTFYKLEYLPDDTSECNIPLYITVSRYNDNGEEELYEVVPLDKSYKDTLISFTEYLHGVVGLIFGGTQDTHYYSINVSSKGELHIDFNS